MKYLPTTPIARTRNQPYTMRDILLERVQFEDRLSHRAAPAPVIPKHTQETPVQDMEQWSPAALYMFARHISRRSMSLITP